MFRWIEKRTMPPGTYWDGQQYVEPGTLGAVVTDTGMIAWAKGVLVAWSKTDGSLQSLAMNYGLDPQDITPTWTQRDGIELNLFTVWWNLSGKTPALPASPIVGAITVAQLTDAHLTALTTWATQKGLTVPSVPQPAAPAPPGWPASFPWPPPRPPLWPAGVAWPPLATMPGAPPQGWPASLPWDVTKWLPPGWPAQFPFPFVLPPGWQPAPAAPASPPAPQPQPTLPPAPTPIQPAPPSPAAPTETKSGVSVPLIIGGVIIAGIGVLALMTRRGPAQLMENPSVDELKKHGAKMLNWHGGQGDAIYAVGSYHYSGKLYPTKWVIEQAERDLHKLLAKEDDRELQSLIRDLHKFYPRLFR